MIAWGLARYGYRKEVSRLVKVFFDASLFDSKQRLPELYCGFRRRDDEGPTPYPVACSPQAWAAASVFFLLQACCGLRVQAHRKRIVLENPTLPGFLKEVVLRDIRIGSSSVDLTLQRYTRTVGVDVLRRDGELEVITVK
jgi:glycogen debranching enzyme